MQRLLVVEDESDIADLLRHVFSKEGFQVDLARDGVAALELLRREPPDLVVLDWMLPELSGIEVLKEMRARHETRMVPVILLTARREEIDRVLGLELGADDHVTEPSRRGMVLHRAPKRGWSRDVVDRTGVESESDRIVLRICAVVGGKALNLASSSDCSRIVRAKDVRTRGDPALRGLGLRLEVLSRTRHARQAPALQLREAADWLVTGGVGYRSDLARSALEPYLTCQRGLPLHALDVRACARPLVGEAFCAAARCLPRLVSRCRRLLFGDRLFFLARCFGSAAHDSGRAAPSQLRHRLRRSHLQPRPPAAPLQPAPRGLSPADQLACAFAAFCAAPALTRLRLRRGRLGASGQPGIGSYSIWLSPRIAFHRGLSAAVCLLGG